MEYVLGVDLGTSAVKVLLVDQKGKVTAECSRDYPLYHEGPGYSEQDPDDWVRETKVALTDLVKQSGVLPDQIKGLSFSGQMHGLILLDEQMQPLRRAILWNDTRTSEECREIEERLGLKTLLDIAKNRALEGFTLPKLLWVKKHEPELFKKASVFLLPKDYVRYCLTGHIAMDLSDAAGTLLLDVAAKKWSDEIAKTFGLDPSLFPPLVESEAYIGDLNKKVAEETGLSVHMKVFAGGADNACGATGSGILSPGKTMCSIGTSGVVLSYEENDERDFNGKLHYFNHAKKNSFYSMGVTLAAGYSLGWFRKTFAAEQSFDHIIANISEVPCGSKGLLFTPYIVGERTPHADSQIRGSFLGVDATHTRWDFARSVIEGITFSLNESIKIMKESGQTITSILSIGGGAKSETWLQIQADVFNTPVVQLQNEQGPGLGAAMLAAVGCGWFDSLEACADAFIETEKTLEPIQENVERYEELFALYQQVYPQSQAISHGLQHFK
ncbi:xylulokinase [Pullulanibacillus pueri]|uniref:Xylulose kinase n=1 Tax=Pullulanibacillus pueri TaxID=1437324 RepID=A0A8J2ZTI0_9BACL|nr:xylulokinase [Pullulanibacillus pueri]MBM7681827.1 xylulokinase [Pullulanibacillus pueri]GGH76244.1 xylulose kinase [Pullulanibacillus pueri]